MNLINSIFLILCLVAFMVLLKCTNFLLTIHFLNFVQLFHPQVLLIIILPVLLLPNITSLFTNILLQGSIAIARNLIFNRNFNLNITKKQLEKLFLFATSQTHFIFNSKFYNQIDGEQSWFLLWLLSLLISSWVFTNLSG